MSVLVDSSVWIEYFRGSGPGSALNHLIDENLVVVNDLILAELLPALHMRRQRKLTSLLKEVARRPVDVDWDDIVQLQITCLHNGIFRTNVLGTQTLLEAAHRVGLARFHHISTCEVYGDLPLDSNEDFTEESSYRPRTPYNASKASADHAVRAYFETFALPVTISICCNNYGSFQFPEKVIPLFAALAMDDRPLPLYASTGNQREYIHVLDHCRAIERILIDGRIGETYNVGTGVEKSIMEIADAVLDTLGKPQSLKTIVADRPGHDRRYLLNSGKVQRELSWAPQIDFEQGMRETITWYEENREWWEPLREKALVAESKWHKEE